MPAVIQTPAITDFRPPRPLSYPWVAWLCLSRPRVFFRGLRQASSLGRPLIFMAESTVLGLVLKALVSPRALTAESLGLELAAGMAQPVLVAALLWVLVRWLFGKGLALGQTLRVVAYPGAVWVLAGLSPALPTVGGVALWAAIVATHLNGMMRGLMVMARLSLPLAVACLAMALVALMVLASLVTPAG